MELQPTSETADDAGGENATGALALSPAEARVLAAMIEKAIVLREAAGMKANDDN